MVKKTLITLIIIIVGIGLIILIFNLNPFRKYPPEGVPNDYFEHITTISKLDIDIKVYGLGVTLPNEIKYKQVDKLDYDLIYSWLHMINAFTALRNVAGSFYRRSSISLIGLITFILLIKHAHDLN